MSTKKDIFDAQINQLSNSITSKAEISGRKHISELKPIVDNLNTVRLMTSTELCEVLCTAFNNIPDAALFASTIITDGIFDKACMITRGLWGGTKNITTDGLVEMWQAAIDNVEEIFNYYTELAQNGYPNEISSIMDDLVIQECKTRGFIPPDRSFEVIAAGYSGNFSFIDALSGNSPDYMSLALVIKYPLANTQLPYHVFGFICHAPDNNFLNKFVYPSTVTNHELFVDDGTFSVSDYPIPSSVSDFDYTSGYSFSLSQADFDTYVQMPTE